MQKQSSHSATANPIQMSGVNATTVQETRSTKVAAIEKWANKSCHTTLLCATNQQNTTLAIHTEIMH